MKAIKKCPFCGGAVKLSKMHLVPVAKVLCDKCGAMVIFRGNEGEIATVKLWNSRAADKQSEK